MNEMGTTLSTQHNLCNHSQTATSTPHYHGFSDLPYVPLVTQSAFKHVLFKNCHGTPTISYWLSRPLLP